MPGGGRWNAKQTARGIRRVTLDEVIPIGIDEKVRTIRAPREPVETRDWLKPQPKDTYEATGRLTLWLGTDRPYYGHERTWSDGKRQRLETCLHDVMIGFVQVVEARRAARRAEERQRRCAEEERQRQITAQRWQREKDRREELQRQVQAWFRAHELRTYLVALRTAGHAELEQHPDGRLARWLRWAEGYLREIDPMQSVELLPLNPEGYGRKPVDLEGFAVANNAPAGTVVTWSSPTR